MTSCVVNVLLQLSKILNIIIAAYFPMAYSTIIYIFRIKWNRWAIDNITNSRKRSYYIPFIQNLSFDEINKYSMNSISDIHIVDLRKSKDKVHP